MKDLKLIWNGRASGLLGASIIFIHSGFMIVRDKLTSYLTKKNLGTTGYNVRINSFFTYRYPNNITLGNNISIARGVKLSSENPSGKLVINDNVILTFDVLKIPEYIEPPFRRKLNHLLNDGFVGQI